MHAEVHREEVADAQSSHTTAALRRSSLSIGKAPTSASLIMKLSQGGSLRNECKRPLRVQQARHRFTQSEEATSTVVNVLGRPRNSPT